MQPLVEYHLELGDRRTRALELDGDGPPVVLFHGYADSADTWRLTLARFQQRGRRAIALDMPGFGEADRLDRDRPILEQLDEFVAAAAHHVAEEHGEPVVLCGNSLGGCVSLRAAARHDLPVRGVVPVSPAGFDHPVWFGAIEAQPLIRLALRAPVYVPERVVRGLVGGAYRQLAFARPGAADPGVVAHFTAFHRSRRDVVRHLATGRRLLPELRGCFSLADVEVPVLLIWGDRDRMVTHRGSRHVLEALPDTELVLLDGVGHCPQLEDPDRFTDALLRFEPARRRRAVRSSA